ncbi:MAG: hypothetical protein M0Q51_03165 [Bacteroidales bacterium]|nr:hypothetical protein [Bacteroidales bacterium]
MIDFVKIRIENDNIQNIKNNTLLDWEQLAIENTGEIKEYTAIYHGITFTIIHNKYLYVTGSLHKYWNSINLRGEQNYNDFTFSDLTGVIKEFCTSFDLEPGSCILENIEFGVNINPPVLTKEFLRSIINHKGKPFTHEYRENKYFRECERERYIIKAYDKGGQYKQGNIFRFENKTRKMEHLKKIGVSSLVDLLNPVKLHHLGVALKKDFDGLLVYDYTIPSMEIKTQERLILTQGQTPAYWLNLLENNPNLYYKKRIRFKDLVKKHANQDISEIVGKLIIQKWNDLLYCDPKTLQKLTGVVNSEFTEINSSGIGLKPVMFDIEGNTPDTQVEENVTEPPRRYCLSCGRDISRQRPTSRFCGVKYVGYIEAHRCRNNDSNFRNRVKYLIQREQNSLTLFDPIPFIIELKHLHLAKSILESVMEVV